MTKSEQRAYEAKRLVILAAAVTGVTTGLKTGIGGPSPQAIAELAERITEAVMREEAKRTT